MAISISVKPAEVLHRLFDNKQDIIKRLSMLVDGQLRKCADVIVRIERFKIIFLARLAAILTG